MDGEIYITAKDIMRLTGLKKTAAYGLHKHIRDSLAVEKVGENGVVRRKRFLTVREYCEYLCEDIEEVCLQISRRL